MDKSVDGAPYAVYFDDPMGNRESGMAAATLDDSRYQGNLPSQFEPDKSITSAPASLVSLAPGGLPADGRSCSPRYRRDGRLDFDTQASNIAPTGADADNAGDKAGRIAQAFVIEPGGRSAIYVSRNRTTGALGNGDSTNVSLTPDRRFGVFESLASNLVDNDTNDAKDIYLFELRNLSGRTSLVRVERISVTRFGAAANGPSRNPTISDDGNIVTFETDATNLIPGDTNNASDIVVKSIATGDISSIFITADGLAPNGGSSGPAMIPPFVFADSNATNLLFSQTSPESPKAAKDTAFRQAVRAGLGQSNFYASRNPTSGELGNGDSKNLSVAPSGRFGVFESTATNLIPGGDTNGFSDIYRFEIVNNRVVGMVRASVGRNGEQTNGHSRNARISEDGQFVAFESDANNLVSGDTNGFSDVYVKSLATGQISRLATTADNAEPNDASGQPAIKPDGSAVAFASRATNLVAGDINGFQDIFEAPVQFLSSGPRDEPAQNSFALPAPDPANASCPAGFFVASVDDGPGSGLSPGIFGVEVLLDAPGTRVLAGGLNFGGLIDAGQVGFAGFNFANAANESQRLNLRVTGSPASSSAGSLPVRIRIARRPDATTNVTVFETTTTLTLATAYTHSIDLPPAFYEATVAPLSGSIGGAADGQFFFELTTSFTNRPGGGFQGGAVVGGYHAAHPFGGVSGFAGFCLATPHTTSIRVRSQPSYGPTGAKDLRFRLRDAQDRNLLTVPAD